MSTLWNATLDSIMPLDRRWLLVGRFCQRWANIGLSTTTQIRYLYILPTLGQHWIFIQDGGEQ